MNHPYRSPGIVPPIFVPPRMRGVRDVREGDVVRVIRVKDPLAPQGRMLGRAGIVTAIADGIAHVRFPGHVEGLRFARHELARIA